MAIEWITVIEGGIPTVGGLYATSLGYGLVHASRAIPNPQTQKTMRLFRWLGPLVGCLESLQAGRRTHMSIARLQNSLLRRFGAG